MGVYVDMFVAAADGRRLSFDQFKLLVTSLVEQRMVCFPFAIVEGDFTVKDEDGAASCSHPISMTITGPRNPSYIQTQWQRGRGTSLDELQTALHALPFGQVDLAVHFDSLDWDNAELREALEKHGRANADVVIYALKRPAEVVLGSAYVEDGDIHSYTLMHYFTTTGKSGPRSIAGTPLQSLLADFFGPALLVDCAWS